MGLVFPAQFQLDPLYPLWSQLPESREMSNRKSLLNWVKNLGYRLRYLYNAPNSASSSPGIVSVLEGKSGATLGVLDLTNIQNDCYNSPKSNNGLKASDATRCSNPSQPQGLADLTPAEAADLTLPQP
jgi:hypothetical protein